METHEHLLSDEELPGPGILDPDFARNMIREQEEAGMIVWCEHDDGTAHYKPSARMLMGAVSMNIAALARDIDPNASIEEITSEVVGSLPWASGVTAVDTDGLPDGGIQEMLAGLNITPEFHLPLDPDAEIPDTFPEDWAQ